MRIEKNTKMEGRNLDRLKICLIHKISNDQVPSTRENMCIRFHVRQRNRQGSAHEIRFHRNRNKETGRDLNENFSTNVDNVEHV